MYFFKAFEIECYRFVNKTEKLNELVVRYSVFQITEVKYCISTN